MAKKLVLIVVMILLLIIAAYFAFFMMKSAPALVAPAAPAALNKPAVIGTMVSSTIGDITVQIQDGSQKTFSVSSSTQVMSQVASGQTGKSLATLAPGTRVLLIPDDSNPTSAASISVVPMAPPPPVGASGTPISVDGTLVSKTASSFVLAVQGSGNVTVLINTGTAILSNVSAGQVGKSLSDTAAGAMLQVSGTTGVKGVTANAVVILGH